MDRKGYPLMELEVQWTSPRVNENELHGIEAEMGVVRGEYERE